MVVGVCLLWNVCDCVVVFCDWLWGLGGVIILGNVILYIGLVLDVLCCMYVYQVGYCIELVIGLYDYECVYVYQYMVLGLLYLLVYLLCGGVSVCNFFECVVDVYVMIGCGWWL